MNAPAPKQITDVFGTLPDTILPPTAMFPKGLEVPGFQIGLYPCNKGDDGKLAITSSGQPLVNINYRDAIAGAAAIGCDIDTATRSLATAYHIAAIDENWTGGKVGKGKLFQGVRKWNLNSALTGDYVPTDPDERPWLYLPDGSKIYHFAGGIYGWMRNDIDGDAEGLVCKPFAEGHPLLTIPYPTEDKGQGWTPCVGTNWSGSALIRGGCWSSSGYAGVFNLDGDDPRYYWSNVGVRWTYPN